MSVVKGKSVEHDAECDITNTATATVRATSVNDVHVANYNVDENLADTLSTVAGTGNDKDVGEGIGAASGVLVS